MYRKAMNLRSNVLGEEHPDTLIIMGNLGGNVADQRRYDESCTLLDKACAGLVRVLGEDHPATRAYCDLYRIVLASQERERTSKRAKIRRGLTRLGIRTSNPRGD
jgi:hypothetical protein